MSLRLDGFTVIANDMLPSRTMMVSRDVYDMLKADPRTPRADGGMKNHDVPCQLCGEKPTVATTRLCGPHCFGDANTADGDW